MSFILDALKKSENDRQRQSGPALFEVKVEPPKAGFPVWAIAIVALLAINMVIVGWMLLRRTAHSEESGAQPAAGQVGAGQSTLTRGPNSGTWSPSVTTLPPPANGGPPPANNMAPGGQYNNGAPQPGNFPQQGGNPQQGNYQQQGYSPQQQGDASQQDGYSSQQQGYSSPEARDNNSSAGMSQPGAMSGGMSRQQPGDQPPAGRMPDRDQREPTLAGGTGGARGAGAGAWGAGGARGVGSGAGAAGTGEARGDGASTGAWGPGGAAGGATSAGARGPGVSGGAAGGGQAGVGGSRGPAGAGAAGVGAAGAGGQGAGEGGGANPDDYAPAEDPGSPIFKGHVRRGTESGLMLYQDLAVTNGANLPELRLDMHVYDPKPQNRFALINMQKLLEGQSIKGVQVEAILPEGVVMSHNGTKFLLPRD